MDPSHTGHTMSVPTSNDDEVSRRIILLFQIVSEQVNPELHRELVDKRVRAIKVSREGGTTQIKTSIKLLEFWASTYAMYLAQADLGSSTTGTSSTDVAAYEWLPDGYLWTHARKKQRFCASRTR